MWIRIPCLLVAAMPLIGECISVPEPREEGELEVIATDLTGQRISTVQLELFPGASRIAEVTTSSSTMRVRYGNYRLRIYAKGFESRWRDISIAQPKTFVQVELQAGSVACPPPPATIGGKIKSDGSHDDMWVKVIPVRGTGGGETRVGPSGYFVVSGLEHSTYLVIVVEGESIRNQQVAGSTTVKRLAMHVNAK